MESDKHSNATQFNGFKKNIKGGYDLPNGYFADMKALVMAKAGQTEAPSWRTSVKSMLGFVGGFAAMVLLGVGIVQFTPSQNNANESDVDLFILYSALSEDEIIDIVYPDNTNNQGFDAAVNEYVLLYGGIE